MFLKKFVKAGVVGAVVFGFAVGVSAQLIVGGRPDRLDLSQGDGNFIVTHRHDALGVTYINYKSAQRLQQVENERAAREFRPPIAQSHILEIRMGSQYTVIILKNGTPVHRYRPDSFRDRRDGWYVINWSPTVAFPFEIVLLDENRNSEHKLRVTVSEMSAEERREIERGIEEAARIQAERRLRTFNLPNRQTASLSDGTLTVRASWIPGYCARCDTRTAPWHDFRNEITDLNIEFTHIQSSIGREAFRDLSNLRTVRISGHIVALEFGEMVFHGSNNITTIIIDPGPRNPNPPNLSMYVGRSETFPQTVMQNACLYVPANSVNAYRRERVWREFRCIRPIE